MLAFLWKDGVMTNLGTVAGDACSVAFNINSHSQVVGSSVPANHCFNDRGHAFLWENGTMLDLNVFVPAGSGLSLIQGAYINDRGEILAIAVQPNGDFRTVLLVPDGDCDDACEGRIAESQNNAPIVRQNSAKVTEGAQSPLSPIERMSNQMHQRSHVPGQGPSLHD